MAIRLITVTFVLSAILMLTAQQAPAGVTTAPQRKDTVITDYVRARQHFHRGLDQFRAERYDSAQQSFEKALGILPQFADSALYLGLCYYHTSEFERGAKIIEEAKTKYLQWFEISNEIKRQEYDEAQERISELKVRIQELKNRKATTTSIQEQNDLNRQILALQAPLHSYEAVERPMLASPVVPANYYFHCGNCYLKMQKWNEAFQEYMKAVEVDPDYGDAHNNLAYIYYLAKQYDNAWKHLQRAEECGVEVNPKIKQMLQKEMKK